MKVPIISIQRELVPGMAMQYLLVAFRLVTAMLKFVMVILIESHIATCVMLSSVDTDSATLSWVYGDLEARVAFVGACFP